MVDKKNVIQRLSAIPSRGAGTKGEVEAAGIVEETMRSFGFSVSHDKFKTPASFAILHLVHFLPLLIASLLVNYYPIAASVAGLLVLISFWGEFTRRFFIARRILPHSTSQNVIGRLGESTAPIKIVISAHLDAARNGIVFHPKVSNFFGRFKRYPQHLFILAIIIILSLVFIVKAFGGGSPYLSIVFNLTAAFVLFGCLLMLQWELSPFAPGANDDLSGVAVLLGIAQEIVKDPPPNIEFFFLAAGSEEPHCNGMEAFIKAHKGELPKENTYFINMECLGGGRLKYVTREGFIILQRHHHTLIQLCESVARKYEIDFKPCSTVAHSDSIVPLVKGYKSIGIISLNENFVPTNYHRPTDTENKIDYDLLDQAEETILEIIAMLIEFKKQGYV